MMIFLFYCDVFNEFIFWCIFLMVRLNVLVIVCVKLVLEGYLYNILGIMEMSFLCILCIWVGVICFKLFLMMYVLFII